MIFCLNVVDNLSVVAGQHLHYSMLAVNLSAAHSHIFAGLDTKHVVENQVYLHLRRSATQLCKTIVKKEMFGREPI